MTRPLVLLLALALALAGCGGDDGDEEEAATTAATVTETSGGGTEAGCRDVEEPAPRESGGEQAPTEILSADKTYHVVVRTSCGDFTIELDLKASPKATASFVALAENDFFDGTVFHRIVPGFVIQGGDPTASGAGGPGYSTVDTPAAGTTYEQGIVAMAKTATEARGTAGSQFFVVTAADAQLPPDYAVIGKVTDGLDVVERIGLLGDPNTELPTQPVVVEVVEVHVT